MSSRVSTALRRARSTLPDRLTALYGFVTGTCAFGLGYLITYVLEGHRVESPMRSLVEFFYFAIDAGRELNVGPEGPLPGAHQFAAWQYLSLHGVEFEQRAGVVWTLAPPASRLLVFVPALLLLGAGAVVVRKRGTDDPWTAATRGGAVALGYLPLVVLAALASQWAAPESVAIEYFGVTTLDARPVGTIGVSVRQAALIAGVAYPVAFGAVGGYLAFAWYSRTWPIRALARGAAAGALAFLVGWGVIVRRSFARANGMEFWRTGVIRDGPGEEASVALDPGAFRVGTWQFHRLHGGNVEVRYLEAVADGIDAVRLPVVGPASTRGPGITSGNAIDAFGLPVLTFGPGGFNPVFVLVPALLAVAGAAVAVRAANSDRRGAAARGSAVVLGYLPLSLVTAFSVTSETTGSIQAVIGVEFIDAFLLTGLAVPIVFGGVGGVVTYSVTARTDFRGTVLSPRSDDKHEK